MTDTERVTTSVIVPVYNDPEGLRTTLDSLLDQTADDYEIIIADNGSTDRTALFAKQYATRERVTRVVEDDIQGSYAARNAGIGVAEGKILCFVDADMWVDTDWVESVQRRMREGNIDYMGCNVEIVLDSDTFCGEYNRRTGFPVAEYIDDERFAPTCCLVVRRQVIEDVGPFDERLISSGDVEFGRRVHCAGYEQAFAPDITMYHPARETLRALISKRYRISRGDIQRARYHPDLFDDSRHPLHPFNFLPVRPATAYELRDNDPVRRLCVLYLLLCFLKYVTSCGRLVEWLRPVRGRR